MADDQSSDLSSLSSLSPAPSDDEGEVQLRRDKGILKFFHKLPKGEKPVPVERDPSPPPRKRSPSPPHEYVLADNPDIAFLVMFRSRFDEAFPRSLANFGPQELERDVSEPAPGERSEQFLCAVLGLLLNRKQDVKPGHYNRALEDAISSHKNQWARDWEQKNPLSGGSSFATMTPTERLTLLRTLVVWALSSSETLKGIINKSYKQNRHEDDLNQPLSVQPWGADSDKRRYYLIEGLDDTNFRVYRESNPQGLKRTWWSVAGSIDELKALAEKLETSDAGPRARKLAQKMISAVPRFEATEEKRRRREYRLMQKERFKRREPAFSMYEGRTRGKRMKYTYSDDEDFMTDSTGRRSARNTGTHTPAEPAGPVTTASGRQIKAPSRMTVDSSNNLVTTGTDQDGEEANSHGSPEAPSGRPRRSAATSRQYNSADEDLNDEVDDASEPDLGDDEDEHVPDESEEEDDEFDEDEPMADGDDLDDVGPKSHIVTLKVPNRTSAETHGSATDADDQKNGDATNVDSKPTDGDAEKSSSSKSAAPEKQPTPEAPIPASTSGLDKDRSQKRPPTPNSNGISAASLAFRGSPDKAQGGPPQVNLALGGE